MDEASMFKAARILPEEVEYKGGRILMMKLSAMEKLAALCPTPEVIGEMEKVLKL